MGETSSIKICNNKTKKKLSWKGELTLRKFESVMSQVFKIDFSKQIIKGFYIEHIGFLSIKDFIRRKNEFINPRGSGKENTNGKTQKKYPTLYMKTEKMENDNIMASKNFSNCDLECFPQNSQTNNANNYENNQQTSANHSQQFEAAFDPIQTGPISQSPLSNQNKPNMNIIVPNKNTKKTINNVSMGKATYLANTRIDEIISQEDNSSKGTSPEIRSAINKKTSENSNIFALNKSNSDIKKNASFDKSISQGEHISPISIKSENIACGLEKVENKLYNWNSKKTNEKNSNFGSNKKSISHEKRDQGTSFCPIFEISSKYIDTLSKVKTYFKKEPFLLEKILILFKINELNVVQSYQKMIGTEIKDYKLCYSIQNISSAYQTVSVIVYGVLLEEIEIPEDESLLENHYKETQSLILNNNIHEKLTDHQVQKSQNRSLDSTKRNSIDKSTATVYSKNSLPNSYKEKIIKEKMTPKKQNDENIMIKNLEFDDVSYDSDFGTMVYDKKINNDSKSRDSDLSGLMEKKILKPFDKDTTGNTTELSSPNEFQHKRLTTGKTTELNSPNEFHNKRLKVRTKSNEFTKSSKSMDESKVGVDKILTLFQESRVKEIQDFLEENFNLDHERRKICDTMLDDNMQILIFMIENCIRGFYGPVLLVKKLEQICMAFEDPSEIISQSNRKSEINEDDFVGQTNIEKKNSIKQYTSDQHITLKKSLKDIEYFRKISTNSNSLDKLVIHPSCTTLQTSIGHKLMNIEEVSQLSEESPSNINRQDLVNSKINIIEYQLSDRGVLNKTQKKTKFLKEVEEKEFPEELSFKIPGHVTMSQGSLNCIENAIESKNSILSCTSQTGNRKQESYRSKKILSFDSNDDSETSNEFFNMKLKVDSKSDLFSEDAYSNTDYNTYKKSMYHESVKVFCENSIMEIERENLNIKLLSNIKSFGSHRMSSKEISINEMKVIEYFKDDMNFDMQEDLLGGFAKFLIKPDVSDQLKDLEIQVLPNLGDFDQEKIKMCQNIYFGYYVKKYLGIKTDEFIEFIENDEPQKALRRQFRINGDMKTFLVKSKEIIDYKIMLVNELKMQNQNSRSIRLLNKPENFDSEQNMITSILIKDTGISEMLAKVTEEKKDIFSYIFKNHQEINRDIQNFYQPTLTKVEFDSYIESLFQQNNNELIRNYLEYKFQTNNVLVKIANESHKKIFVGILNKEETITKIDSKTISMILDSYECYLLTLDDVDFWESVKYSGLFK